jgi:chitin synthase
MKQRRRWINSSLFAFLYVYKNYYFHAMDSKHNFFDKYVKLNLSMFLALLSLLSSYITPSIYFYVLYQTIVQIDITSNRGAIAARIVSIAYVMVYLVAVAGGLTGSIWTKHAYLVSAVLSCFTFAMLGLVLYNLFFVYLGFTTTGIDYSSFTQVIILIMVIVNIGMYYFLVLMHLPTHPQFVLRLFIDQFSYLTFQGAYSQTMVSHAFCNVDDVSWGTKGSTGSHGGKKYETEKVFFVSSWYSIIYSGYFTMRFYLTSIYILIS